MLIRNLRFYLRKRHRVLAKMARDWWWPRGRYRTVVARWQWYAVSVIISFRDGFRAAWGALGRRGNGRARKHEVQKDAFNTFMNTTVWRVVMEMS